MIKTYYDIDVLISHIQDANLRGISCRKLALRAGIRPETIHRIIKKRTGVTLEMASKIMNAKYELLNSIN